MIKMNMILKVLSVAIFLPIVVYSLTQLSDRFRTEYVCDMDYGQILEATGARSVLSCGGTCSRRTDCRSFVFNPQDKMCQLNSQILLNPTYGCPVVVKYGYFLSSNPGLIALPPFEGKLVGESCVDSIECVENFTECSVTNECMCIPGYVYDYANRTCIFIMDCLAYGITFQMSETTEYKLTVDILLNNATEDECRAICLTTTQFTCRIFEFSYKRMECKVFSLDTIPRTNVIDGYDKEYETFVYARDCALPATTMFTACDVNSDCLERDSVCFQGICLCRVGFSYDSERRKCVSECFLYSKPITGNSYQRISGIYITNFNFSRTYPVQSGPECLNYCTSDTNISCVSFMTDMTSNTCYLSEQTLGVYPDASFISNFAYTIVQLDCEPMTSPIEMIPCYGNVCSATNSECRNGVCKCVQGLRYQPSLDQCTETCTEMYGNTFQTILDFHVDQHNEVTLNMTSNDVINECKAACVKEDSFVCLMAEINFTTNECTLSSEAYTQIWSVYKLTDINYVTMIRDCA
ncbi:uncharacterized protein LOC132736562 [Ruditapes philippinarum]|uniref:uncharacterized protein LOC132736562 n=1 Tax=Ruditapes philippinarum TaxID=129788 RepID=UPI00295B3BB6|nr:uncharacterized protein LOC132736562 [Ruditapes philippinarum]